MVYVNVLLYFYGVCRFLNDNSVSKLVGKDAQQRVLRSMTQGGGKVGKPGSESSQIVQCPVTTFGFFSPLLSGTCSLIFTPTLHCPKSKERSKAGKDYGRATPGSKISRI